MPICSQHDRDGTMRVRNCMSSSLDVLCKYRCSSAFVTLSDSQSHPESLRTPPVAPWPTDMLLCQSGQSRAACSIAAAQCRVQWWGCKSWKHVQFLDPPCGRHGARPAFQCLFVRSLVFKINRQINLLGFEQFHQSVRKIEFPGATITPLEFTQGDQVDPFRRQVIRWDFLRIAYHTFQVRHITPPDMG